MKTIRLLKGLAVAAVLLLASILLPAASKCAGGAPEAETKRPDAEQRGTMGVISRLDMVIDGFVRERGRAPDSLEALVSDEEFFIRPEKRQEWLLDGWGRPVI